MTKLYAFLFACLFFFLKTNAQHSSLNIKNLVFEGGGIRGVAYCGALHELENRGKLVHVKRAAGTSSGAITACLLAVGYKPSELTEIIGNMNFGKFNDGRGLVFGGMRRLKKHMGYYKGEKFEVWLENLISAKTGNKSITFLELYTLSLQDSSFKELIVTGTCMNHQEAIYFNRFNFPNMPISRAVRASMAVPLYYEPVVLNDIGERIQVKKMGPEHHVCLDGGFVSNYPIWIFDEPPYALPTNTTLGLRIDKAEQIEKDRAGKYHTLAYPIHSTSDLVGSIYYIMKENLNRHMLDSLDWSRTISISDAGIGPKVKRLSSEQKELFLNEGKKGVSQYFENKP
jgi:NTE family protein